MTESELEPLAAQARQVDAINQQARDIYFQQPEQAVELFEQACILAQTGAFADQPYRAGLAASLAGLARLHMETRPDQAAKYCLQTLSLLDGYPVIPPLIEAKHTLGWIYFHLGDYSSAMEWALQALHLSQEISLPKTEAMALDLIANIHGMVNELPQALSAHQDALKIAQDLKSKQQEGGILNNMAMTLLDMGDHPAALEIGYRCLRIFRELNMVRECANCYDTLAQIYLGMGDFEQAERHLLNGLQIITPMENQLVKTYLLKGLGRVYLAQSSLPDAVTHAQKALGIAQQSGLRSEMAECHHLLAEVYEQQADYACALAHFKQFHQITDEITGDTAAKRLALLNVIHQVENAKHEADIYRLRSIELQSEIDERKRVQVALEDLATRDQLTSLFNRRYFLEKSEQEYGRAIRYQHPMAVIMIDLDHFKLINDTYGHAIGDQVLAMVGRRMKEQMRQVDIAGRMGGEEFALVLPETSLEGARQAAERLLRSFSTEPLVVKTHAIRVTASVGVTCFIPTEPNGPPTFDTLLQQADEALYIAKNAGRNQVQVFLNAQK